MDKPKQILPYWYTVPKWKPKTEAKIQEKLKRIREHHGSVNQSKPFYRGDKK